MAEKSQAQYDAEFKKKKEAALKRQEAASKPAQQKTLLKKAPDPKSLAKKAETKTVMEDQKQEPAKA